jgi:long-chain acyl-CoA synthetase
MTLVHHLLEASAERFGNREALTGDGRRITYAELDREAACVAAALVTAGVERGDRVVVFMDNSVETVASVFGALKAGAVFSIVNPTTKRDKLMQILDNCRPAAVIVDERRVEMVCGLTAGVQRLRLLLSVTESRPSGTGSACTATWHEVTAGSAQARLPLGIDQDLATIIYTSGSTGTPKGVMSTHRNVIAATTSINAYLRNTAADVILNVLPLSFDYGLYQLFLAFQVGARVVLERSFSYPAVAIQRMREEQVTGFPCVPTIFSLLLQQRREPYDLPQLRYLTNTAAALPPSHIERIRSLFPQARLFSMYGLTECKRVSYLPPEELDRKPGSVGIAIPNSETYVVDEQGRRLGPNCEGELVVRGSHVMRGYWECPEETAKRYRPGPIPGETVLFTGDLVRMDEEGFLYFIGRKDDIIKSRGEKVSPKEVENAVLALPGVIHAAVVSVPDPILGEAVRLVVAVAEGSGISDRRLRQHCHEHLEDFMQPKFVEIWPELPRTPAGKIDKLAIRAAQPVTRAPASVSA